MRRVVSEIISGIVAGIAFVGFYMWMHFGLGIALALSIGVYVGFSIALKPPKIDRQIELTGLTQDALAVIIKNGKAQVKRIRTDGEQVKDLNVKENIFKICQVADAIFDDFIKDPKDVRAARKFIDYYLDTTQRIVLLYCDLSKKTVYTDKEKMVLEKAEQILIQIEETFHKQLGKLQEDDYLDLATELEVLEMTMKSEGI